MIRKTPHQLFKRKVDDLVYKPTISLKDALAGYKVDVTGVDGRPIHLDYSEQVIQPGDIKRVSGLGMLKKAGGRGDLAIRFKVGFPRYLSREQKDAMVRYLPN